MTGQILSKLMLQKNSLYGVSFLSLQDPFMVHQNPHRESYRILPFNSGTQALIYLVCDRYQGVPMQINSEWQQKNKNAVSSLRFLSRVIEKNKQHY